ncbi:EAL domain-containing protein [Lentibacillus sediminis]|uniref:EAL domain-containing protein n=1 Tax=Lentibacillus sediminis TaxID=1940529 RepID=UPI000C1B90BA|nr:EAL domain-containing protein [Lentibacillus sediminis]
MHELTGTYNIWFVGLSVIIAIFASYTALDLGGRVFHSRGWRKTGWLVGGAVTMGIGIWSMHFVGMIAYEHVMVMSYDPFVVFLSIAAACLGALISLFVVSHKTLKLSRLIVSGLFMGAAISSMHYIGMAAMDTVTISYDPFYFSLSILVAIIASMTALKLLFEFSHRTGSMQLLLLKLSGAVLMGVAIAGMHYIGMHAATVQGMNHSAANPGALDSTVIAIGIAIFTILMQSFLIFGTVTDRRQTMQALKLKENEQRYRSLVDNNLDAIFSINLEGQFLSMNKAGARMTGIPEENWYYLPLKKICSEEQYKKAMHQLQLVLEKEDTVNFTMHIDNLKPARDIDVTLIPVYVQGKLDGVYGIAQDITDRLQAEKEIHHMAYFDHLTGLPNRRQFINHLNEMLETQKRFAVFFLDLNRFKVINDALGHSTGDLLLKSAAERLRSCVGEKDLVARLGGDEFTIIMAEMTSPNEPTDLAKRVIEAFEKPFIIQNNPLHATVSIGIAVIPDDGDSPDVIMKHADLAMYASKERSKSKYYYYSSVLSEKTEQQLKMELRLREGIDNHEFYLEYQPQIDSSTGLLLAVEALVRWRRPDGETIQPNNFIPLAEETALIIPLGKQILEMACQQAKAWLDKGFPTRISVNLSARQFQAEDIVKTVAYLLNQYQLPAELIELEVTESMTMENMERSIHILNEFRKLGVSLAIDDFGTAHSSLRYLKDFPIQRLKIDRSFVKEISLDQKTERITSAIIAMGQHLNLDTIAEGVETEEQLSFLRDQHCSHVQGFYYSRPVSVENIEEKYFQSVETGIAE